jgi:hypothetical protein
MRHARNGSLPQCPHGPGCTEVCAKQPASTGAERSSPHALLDERGRQIGQITRASTRPEFGRLEPTLLLRRDDALPIRDRGPDRDRPTPETEECTP